MPIEFPGDDFPPPQTAADAALEPPLGEWGYGDDDYFRRNLPLLRTIKDRDGEVIARLTSYLRYAKNADSLRDIQNELATLEKKLEQKVEREREQKQLESRKKKGKQ